MWAHLLFLKQHVALMYRDPRCIAFSFLRYEFFPSNFGLVTDGRTDRMHANKKSDLDQKNFFRV